MSEKAELFQVEGTHTGLLVAVWLEPALAGQLALPGGESPESLHITLCYCGDANEMDDVVIAKAISHISYIADQFYPLSGVVGGLGRFNASESSDGKDVLFATVDVPGLERLRQMIANDLHEIGCAPLSNHGYTPHVTLLYMAEGAPFPIQRIDTLPLTIKSLSVSVGERKAEIPLTGAYKAGARHSRRDQSMLQTMHDHAVSLGAVCGGKAVMSAQVVERIADYGAIGAMKFAYAPGHENGNALKAIAQTETELRVANYMVLFGGRDLEGIANNRRNGDGSKGEFFTKSTVFDSPYTDIGVLYVDWEHGMAPQDEPGADDPLGFVDWKTARIDDKGLFVERVLNRRNQYVQWLQPLIEEGLIGNSTEAIGTGVSKGKNGEIQSWPLRRDTLTVTPMEPRMISENAMTALKALSERFSILKSVYSAAHDATPETSAAETGGTPVERNVDSGGKAMKNQRDSLLLELELLQL